MKKSILFFSILTSCVIAGFAFTGKTGRAVPKVIPTQTIQPGAAETKWTVDKSHSSVKFTVTHLVISEVEGSFKIFDGTMTHTQADFSDARIGFTVDATSISTDNAGRDKHLKSDDFFATEQFPQLKFESTSFVLQSGNKYKLNGNLTIRDVTKAVTFDVTYGGSAVSRGTAKLGFKAKTTINRFDYGLKWNNLTEAGGLAVGQEVEITVNLEMNQVKE